MSTARRTATTLTAVCAALVIPMAPASAAPRTDPKPFVPALAKVTVNTLNVRTKPTSASPRVDALHKGEVVSPVCSVTGQSVNGNRTWYWTIGRQSGWASARYLRLTQGRVPACPAYPDMKLLNANITKASQVDKQLAGTSASFRKFIARELKTQQAEAGGQCRVEISVFAWWKNDQAIGGVSGCGGYAAMWTYRNGAWHELGTQEVVPCTTLRKAGAKHAINGNTGWVCTVPSVKKGHEPIVVQYVPGK